MGLFGHGGSNNNNKRKNITDGGIGRKRGKGKESTKEEIQVGDPSELLKQGFGKE